MKKDQTPDNAASDQGSTLFALRSEISTKHDNDENYPDILYIGNGPVHKVKVDVHSA